MLLINGCSAPFLCCARLGLEVNFSTQKITAMVDKKVGFVINGAAALIAQELALLETLTRGLNPGASGPVIPNILAGTSSGSLSAIALNAVLQAEAGKGSFTWERLKDELLFPLKDDNIFTTGWWADLEVPFDIAVHGYVLDTNPLKETLEKYVRGANNIGYQTLGNTFLPTHISTVNRNTGLTQRFFSGSSKDKGLDIVEVLLASTAIPVVFPERDITGVGTFVDGGTGTDNSPVEAVADYAPFDELYVIAPQQSHPESDMQKRHESKFPILSNLTFAMDIRSNGLLQFQLFRALGLVKDPTKAFFYTPSLKTEFNFLNFGVMKPQYEETLEWAKQNDPQPIRDYLKSLDFPLVR